MTLFSFRLLPSLDGPIVATRHQAMIRHEIDPRNLAIVSVQSIQQFPIPCTPYLGSSIKGRRHECIRRGGFKFYLRDKIRMRWNADNWFPPPQVPDFDETIVTRRGQVEPILTEISAQDAFGVS